MLPVLWELTDQLPHQTLGTMSFISKAPSLPRSLVYSTGSKNVFIDNKIPYTPMLWVSYESIPWQVCSIQAPAWGAHLLPC